MRTHSPNIIANSLISCATHNGDGAFISFGDRRITWREFSSRVFQVANTLIELGVKHGDKVAFMFHNTPEFLEINFGIQVAGAVPAPMNYRFIPREVEFQGNHCDARVFLYDSIWQESVEAAAPKLKSIEDVSHRPFLIQVVGTVHLFAESADFTLQYFGGFQSTHDLVKLELLEVP